MILLIEKSSVSILALKFMFIKILQLIFLKQEHGFFTRKQKKDINTSR